MYYKICILLLITWLLAFPVSAQVIQDTTMANNYLMLGDSLFSVRQYDSSISYFRNAAEIYKKSEFWERYYKSVNKECANLTKLKKYDISHSRAQDIISESRSKLKKDNPAEAEAYRNIGLNYYHQTNYDSAEKNLKKAVLIIQSGFGESNKRLIRYYRDLGSLFLSMGKYDEALKFLNKNLSIRESNELLELIETARIYENIARVYVLKASYNSGLLYFTKALKLQETKLGLDHLSTASTFYNIALLHYLKGGYDLAIDFYGKALTGYEQHLTANHPRIGLLHNQIGATYLAQGSFSLAEEYLLRALAIWMDTYGEENINVSYAHNNLGLLYDRMERYSLSLSHLEKALNLKKKLLGTNHILLASSYDNIGMNYLANGSFDSAQVNLQRGLKLQIDKYGEIHPDVSFTYTSLGHVFNKKGELQTAIKYHEIALNIRKTLYGSKHPDISGSYNNLAAIKGRQNEDEFALENYQYALIANLPALGEIDFNVTPSITSPLNHHNLLVSLQGKADIFEKTASKGNLNERLNSALINLQLCDTVIDITRRLQIKRDDKLELGKTIAQVYEGAIRVSFRLYNSTKDQKYKDLAFHFVEKSKAGVLTEALSNISAKSFGGIPDGVLAFEKNLKIDISFYQSKIQSEKVKRKEYDTLQVIQWEKILFGLNRSRDSLTLTLEQNYPRYHELKYTNQTLGVAEVQKRLTDNNAVIEYFIGDDNYYIFLITKKEYELFSFANDSIARNEVEAFMLNLKASADFAQTGYDSFVSQSHSLFSRYLKTVLDSIPQGVKEISIIPDGYLSYIPFAILLTEHPNHTAVNYKALPYVLKKYDIGYGYSSTLLFNDFVSDIVPDREMIAFAPIYETLGTNVSRDSAYGEFRDQVTGLKWNQPEIDRINEHIKGTRFLGEKALEADFKKYAGQYNVIHLAMHALLDDENPMNSKLIFTMNNDSIEDGLLHAHELYNMQIPAELVVLSACQTGLGKLSKGEGVMSLARAFSYAGCPSVVMSHWSVNDESTAELMDRFYQNLSLGQSKSEALRKAKLSFLEEAFPPQTHPLFWASFVVMGDNSPLHQQSHSGPFWYLLAGFLTLALFGFLFVKRAKKKLALS